MLIVDDEISTRTMLGMLFEEKGWDVLEADRRPGSGIAVEKQPDLVLLDINLPQMTGFEAITLLRLSNPKTKSMPVIMCTAMDSLDDVERLPGRGERIHPETLRPDGCPCQDRTGFEGEWATPCWLRYGTSWRTCAGSCAGCSPGPGRTPASPRQPLPGPQRSRGRPLGGHRGPGRPLEPHHGGAPRAHPGRGRDAFRGSCTAKGDLNFN